MIFLRNEPPKTINLSNSISSHCVSSLCLDFDFHRSCFISLTSPNLSFLFCLFDLLFLRRRLLFDTIFRCFRQTDDFLLSQILQNLFFRWLFLWHLLKDRCRLFCHSLTLSSSANPTTCQLLCSVSISFFPFPILLYWHSFRRVLLIKQYFEGKSFCASSFLLKNHFCCNTKH